MSEPDRPVFELKRGPLSGRDAVFRVCARLSFHGLLPSLSAHKGGDFEAGTEAALSGEATWTSSRQFGQAGDYVPTGPSTRDTEIACFNFVKQLAKRAHNAAHVT